MFDPKNISDSVTNILLTEGIIRNEDVPYVSLIIREESSDEFRRHIKEVNNKFAK